MSDRYAPIGWTPHPTWDGRTLLTPGCTYTDTTKPTVVAAGDQVTVCTGDRVFTVQAVNHLTNVADLTTASSWMRGTYQVHTTHLQHTDPAPERPDEAPGQESLLTLLEDQP
ncbi:hypothetical protein [Ruania rhizosphaerae]|uniref:hypothetical protein n=1 Tax=Ruania rhizosphaerae TaxID=1840413 RepID=UPI0013589DAA|nr:hypothetical protein [Ruania rhizosphaerae]